MNSWQSSVHLLDWVSHLVWWYTYFKLCDHPWIATAEDRSDLHSQRFYRSFSYVRGPDGEEVW